MARIYVLIFINNIRPLPLPLPFRCCKDSQYPISLL